ncbi:MAG: glycosyltransferase family 2 protein [Spirochaetales bacterium]|nr:glycosyltransferase family 2 protein [Spirochaetales bacterium]
MKLLSLCIPTYNRSESLKYTLESLVQDPAFNGNEALEVVISDNASTDDTAQVAKKYAEAFPGRIRYHRNPENIHDRNFFVALSLGTGEFLKLHNDTLVFLEGALAKLLRELELARKEGWTPFLLNGAWNRKGERAVCRSKQEFLEAVSFYTTWIGGLFIKRNDLELLENFSRRSETKLQQVDVLFRLFSERQVTMVVLNKQFVNVQHPSTRGGYSLAQVFLKNYEGILKEHFDPVRDQKILKKEMHRVLYFHVLPWVFQSRNSETVNYETGDFEPTVRDLFSVKELVLVRLALIYLTWKRFLYLRYKQFRGFAKVLLGLKRRKLE